MAAQSSRTTAIAHAARTLAQEHRNSPSYIAGFDPGNRTTLLSVTDDAFAEVCIPSFVGRGDLDTLLAARGAGGGKGTLGAGEYAITVDSDTFFVGDLAIHQSGNATNACGDMGRYARGHTRLLLLAIVGATFRRSVKLRLVTGVPPMVRKNNPEVERSIKESLQGVHYYTFHDQLGSVSIMLEVEAVVLSLEGVAAAMLEAKAGQPTGVVDIGEFSVDAAVIDEKGAIIAYRTGTLANGGTAALADRISSAFQHTHGRALDAKERQRVLDSTIAETPVVINFRGQKVIDPAALHAAASATARDINAWLAPLWATTGTVGGDLGTVVVVGGGAYHLAKLLQVDAHMHVPDEPEFANVRAYRGIAQMVEDKQRWPL